MSLARPFHLFRSRSAAHPLVVVAGVFAFALGLAGQAISTGGIEGRVFDPKRGEYLEKARITIEGTKQEVLTDATGQYRFANVPAGSVQLQVFYTGLGSQTEIVAVPPGQVVQHDINLTGSGAPGTGPDSVVKLDQFVVSTSKEMDGAAIAINEQRFASNIMQVVSADEFGTIADGSIGEFMKFLPGITADYTGGDARRFSINGVPEDNVPISMGGFEMASAAGAGTRRAVELDQVSINNVARIEINRAPTPESPGASLAGTVNFVPRSSFERSKPSYSYNVQWMFKDAERQLGKTPGPRWGEYTRKVNPGFDVSAIVPVSKTFGFSISAGYSLQYTPQPAAGIIWRGAGAATNQPVTYTGTGTFHPDTTPDNPYAQSFNWRDSGKHTTRHSFSTTIDWKPARYDRLSFGFQYGMLHENFATRTQTIAINRVSPGNWGPTHTWGQFPTFPTTGTALNSGQVQISNGGRIRPGRTVSPSLRWIHDGPVWKSDAGVSYGNSRIHYQDIDLGAFNGVTIRRTHLQVLFDDIFYLRPGKITLLDPNGAPVDPTDLDSYSIVSVSSNRQKTYDTVKQAYYNVRRDFMVRDIPVSIKVGADVRNKVRDLRGPGGNLETYNYVGADGRASTTPFTQAGLVNDDSPARFVDEAFSQRIPDFGLPRQEQVDNKKLWQDYQANPTHYVINPVTQYSAVTRFSRRAEEVIWASFVRGDAAFFNRRLKVVTGVRAEQTNIDAEGPRTDATLGYQRDASGTVIRDAANRPVTIAPTNSLEYAQLTILERGYKAKKEYLRLFPSVNLSYNVRENLIARAAYYQTVGRPDFNQYAGGLTLPDTELTPNVNNATRIQVNNVSIKAWQAESYMARLEYYFGNVGQLSVAYFVRDYENMFGNITTPVTAEFLSAYDLDPDTYAIYDVVTQFNVPGVIRTKGVEVDYRQQLTPFLPNWARGLNFNANFSSQRGKNTFDYFQNMIPFNVNWGLSLVRPKFNLRINENYRGIQRRARVTGRSIEEGTYNYRPKRLYIDVSGEYYFRRSLGLFFSVRNIGGATEDTKIYGPSTPLYARFRQRDDYSSLWTFGVKGTF
ncbi:MAG: carboxypeptidase regulatory-like domain-containing protein [Opitutaceae bacterium]|nr:carboxypeptidase regulatory-like domain-containing protein [Opitutaceae bacterium]